MSDIVPGFSCVGSGSVGTPWRLCVPVHRQLSAPQRERWGRVGCAGGLGQQLWGHRPAGGQPCPAKLSSCTGQSFHQPATEIPVQWLPANADVAWKNTEELKRDLKLFLSPLTIFHKLFCRDRLVGYFWARVSFLHPLPGAVRLRISCQAAWVLSPNSVLLYAGNLDFYCPVLIGDVSSHTSRWPGIEPAVFSALVPAGFIMMAILIRSLVHVCLWHL